jgi:hypothetical protein
MTNESADPGVEPGPNPAPDSSVETESRRLPDAARAGRYLHYAALAFLSLFAVVALFGFYSAASGAINDWISPEYRSLFRAGFNLVVLLLAGIGISYELRRLG